MNKLHWYLLDWLLAKIVKQGYQDQKIKKLYKMLYRSSMREYYGNNSSTIITFLKEHLDEALEGYLDEHSDIS